MMVDCRTCGATYSISDDKVRGRRVRVRCKSCGDGIIVDGTAVPSDDATQVYSPGFSPAAYGESHDAATRVMAPSGMDFAGATQPGDLPEPPLSDEWLVNVSDTDQRSMTLDQMATAYASGRLTDDAFVWREGMTDWVPLLDVEEIRDALGMEDQATQVVRPIDLRVPARPKAAAAPVAYAAPAAPPRARTAVEPAMSIEYEQAYVPPPSPYAQPAARAHAPAYAPPVPPPPRAPPPQARVRERPRADLFGDVDATGGEAELLKNRSMPLDSYDAAPTGARNESSVLFSLNALKAGRHGPQSAPPRRVAAAPTATAADILGMTAGGAVPGLGLESSAALLSAPAVIEPPAERQSTIPPRARMETVQTTRKKAAGRSWVLPAVALSVISVLGAGAFVLRDRLLPAAEPTASAVPAPLVTAAPGAAVAVPPNAGPGPTPPAPQPEAPPPAASAAAPEPAPAVAEPVQAATPEATAAAPAPAQANAVAAPVRPAPGAKAAPARPAEPAPPAEVPTVGGVAKVSLEEEAPPGEAEAPAVDLPPFDTGAAKSALESASSQAASCKKPDGPTGKGKVQVTFSPKSGRATSANVVEGAFGGTPTGGCVAKLFRAAKVPPFSGEPVSVAKSFSIPE